MKKLLLAVQLALAVFMLALASGQAQAVDNYVEGLSIHLEDYPTEVRVGETFNMEVRVVNQSGQTIEALLKTYLYSYASEISYPPPDFGDIVLVNEGDWGPNEKAISLGENDNETFTFSLTVRSDIQLVCTSGGLAKLRASIRRIENGVTIYIAPRDNHYITLLPEAGPGWIAGVKFGVGVAVAAAIVISVAALQQRNNRIARRRARRK